MSKLVDTGPEFLYPSRARAVRDGFASNDQEGGNSPTCRWAQSGDPNVKLSDTGAENPTFTTPTGLTQDTTLEFTLQVTDRGDLTDEDTVSVTILTGG